MSATDHSGLPYKYASCWCAHCVSEEVVSFERYTEIKNAEAREALRREEEEQLAFEKEQLARISSLREQLSSDSVVNVGQNLKEQPAMQIRDSSAQRADWPAMQIQNPDSTVLFSCSNEELALIMRWQLAQAKAWQEQQTEEVK